MSFFTAQGITAGYGCGNVLENISFQAEAGCLTGILGANGSGKTTLLKALCGILPHKGSCRLEGAALEPLSPRQLARLCSYIPQRSGITIDISALDVVLMGFNPQLPLLARPTETMHRQAREALALVGLPDMAHTNYQHLSEGQKQLCILARTLAAGSRLLLLDEPESALDFRFRSRMLTLLEQYCADSGGAAILTLHDPGLALNHCRRLLLLDAGQIIGVLHPETDPPEKMEALLSRIYGSVSLHRCRSRSGKPQLVMLKEDPQ